LTDKRDEIADVLRGRVLRGFQAGALQPGDRLPSARDLAAEFGVDHRIILDAYRLLVGEDLVELRARGGIYVAARLTGGSGVPPLPESWFAGVLADALAREIPAPDLHEWLRRSTETLRLRAVVVASTSDQAAGLCREIQDDFGLDADALLADEVRSADAPPLPLRRADLVITTEAHASWLRPLAASLRKLVIVVGVRPDLRAGEWAMLLRRPVYAIVATPEFGEIVRQFFADVPGAKENLRIVVFGRDDLATIPDGAPTYVTQRVRESLGATRIPGRVLPAARTIAAGSAREIFGFIVRSNIEALRHRTQ
jgi:DNA-binding transcriptional regulator YhcF (GntR family)